MQPVELRQHRAKGQKELRLLVSVLRPTRVRTAKFIGGEEEVQKAVHLAFPSVTVEEDADPGYHALKQKYGQGPDEG